MWDAERIRRLRDALGWSQEQLARSVGNNSRSIVSRWEGGGRSPSGAARRLLEQLEAMARRKGLLA